MKYVIKILNPSKKVIFETERDFNTESAPVEIAKRLLKKLGIKKGGSYKIEEQHLAVIEEAPKDQEKQQDQEEAPKDQEKQQDQEEAPKDQEKTQKKNPKEK